MKYLKYDLNEGFKLTKRGRKERFSQKTLVDKAEKLYWTKEFKNVDKKTYDGQLVKFLKIEGDFAPVYFDEIKGFNKNGEGEYVGIFNSNYAVQFCHRAVLNFNAFNKRSFGGGLDYMDFYHGLAEFISLPDLKTFDFYLDSFNLQVQTNRV